MAAPGLRVEEIEMEDKVRQILETQIRPLLQREGGDIEFVGLEDNVVKVRLQGACRGCPASQMTLQMGVERLLREEVPEVERVVAVP
jgi:Fe-S cluster biogenesis protein NfuA